MNLRGDLVAEPLTRLLETVLCGFVGFLETVPNAIPGGLVGVPDLGQLFVQLGDLVA